MQFYILIKLLFLYLSNEILATQLSVCNIDNWMSNKKKINHCGSLAFRRFCYWIGKCTVVSFTNPIAGYTREFSTSKRKNRIRFDSLVHSYTIYVPARAYPTASVSMFWHWWERSVMNSIWCAHIVLKRNKSDVEKINQLMILVSWY